VIALAAMPGGKVEAQIEEDQVRGTGRGTSAGVA
jgi:hypothetical protein